jgi:outer membrane protein
MRRWIVSLVLVCAATAGPPRAIAESTDESLPGPTAPVELQNGVLRLSVDEAVRDAIGRNLDVELLRFDPLVARQQLRTAWGAFDPQIWGDGGYSNIETPTASTIIGNTLLTQETWSGEAGLRGLIPWLGGSYQAGYAGDEIVTNSRISVLSPQFDASYLLQVSLPLLRGLFWSTEWTLVREGRVNVEQTQAQFEQNLMDQVKQTEDAYWGLTRRRDETRVAEKSLETARALLAQTQAQYEVGVVSKVEVVQAEAGVAQREFNLITAQAVERNAQDALVDIVLGPYLQADTQIHVVLTDRPEDMGPLQVSVAAALEHAMARRPELVAARKAIQQAEIERKYASNQRLPQLDVAGSVGRSGLAGRVSPDCLNFSNPGMPCTAPGVPPHWSDADNGFFGGGRSAQSYTVQGILSIPLGNTAANSRYEIADLNLRRAQTSLKRLEQSIISETRRDARNLSASVEGIQAADRNVTATTEQLRAERVRLEHGESTPFDVLLREQDLVTAQSQKIIALQVYHNSVTDLDRAQGTILESHHITVDQAAPLR